MLGAFDEIAGLVVGKLNDSPREDDVLLDHLVLAHTSRYGFPIVTRVDFGHTDPRLTLPLGVHASLDSAHDTLSLDEPAVA